MSYTLEFRGASGWRRLKSWKRLETALGSLRATADNAPAGVYRVKDSRNNIVAWRG